MRLKVTKQLQEGFVKYIENEGFTLIRTRVSNRSSVYSNHPDYGTCQSAFPLAETIGNECFIYLRLNVNE